MPSITTPSGLMKRSPHSSIAARQFDSFSADQTVDIARLSGASVNQRRFDNYAAQLVQGRWQVMLAPSAAYVATDFRGPKGERPEGSRADGWNEVTVNDSGSVRFVISDKPGAVHGSVTMGAHCARELGQGWKMLMTALAAGAGPPAKTSRKSWRGCGSFTGGVPIRNRWCRWTSTRPFTM